MIGRLQKQHLLSLPSSSFAKKSIICNLSTPAQGKKGPLTKEEIEKGLQNNEKFKNYMRSINSVSPMTLIHDFLPTQDVLSPKNTREVGLLSEMPTEHAQRKVIIEPNPRKSVQQGEANAHQWIITWPNRERWTNPLMGWTSGSDPMAGVKLKFDNKEDAINFAERNGWKYIVKKPTSLTIQPPGTFQYDQNFLPESVRQQLKIEGIKNKIFVNPHYGKSNWFMPLNFHGTAPAEQHGPTKK